ncbi:hypothetical protein BDR06DRAFT_976911 [Suillus hirtellus]|nr:hypothetical protein BDR06DRAFT_976911 [Suillus hirtellus]
MSKHTASGGDEPTMKHHCRISEVNQTGQSALYDNGAWEILKQLLMTSMSLSEMDDALVVYLSNQVLTVLWRTYIPDPSKKPSMRTSASSPDNHLSGSRVNKSHRSYKRKHMYILDEAKEDDEEEEYEEGDGDGDGMSVRSPKVTRMQGPSAKQRLAATFDNMASWFEQNSPSLSQSRKDRTHGAPESRMYLLDIQRTVTEHVTDHLRRKNFPVTLSAWVVGQIYVVADSPKTIADSLHNSLYAAIKKYSRITDEERGAVERSGTALPNPAWVRIRHSKYKGCIGKIFKSGQDTVEVLCPTRNFPYPMPRGCRALVERSCLPKNDSVSDIIIGDEVVGWTFKGERYYMGLLLKHFHCDQLKLLTSPHVDDIQLHLESRWDKPFLKKTVMAFAMQFLRVGDHARVIKGTLRGELGKVISTDHTYGSACLEFTFHKCPEEIEVRLQDIERVFRVGDSVRVITGPYLGLEGHILQMAEDVFHVCQATTNEVVEVSKYYLDRCPLSHTLHSNLQVQQHFEPPPDSNLIEIGDFIQVLDREHTGKCGVVDWLSKGDSNLWFRDLFTPVDKSGLSSISVPIAMVQWTDLMRTIQYMKERGYDVKPGDTMSVAHGLEYGAKGVVQSMDFPNARLTLLCDSDRSLVNVQIRFIIKLHNHCTTVKLHDVITRYGMRLSGAMLEGPDLISFCNMRRRSYLMLPARSITPPVEITPSGLSTSITDLSPSSSNGWASWSTSPGDVDMVHDPASSINPSTSTSDPWAVDSWDTIDAGAEKLLDSGPLPWLMTKEFSSKFLSYHAVFKVSPSFMGGRLNKRDLSPAPPHKKNQHVLILDGDHRGLIQTIASCYTKDSTVKIAIMPTVTITLRFDQICLVEPFQNMSRGTNQAIQISSVFNLDRKDHDEVILAEICIIASDQRYMGKIVLDSQILVQEPTGSPGAYYQCWHQQLDHGRPVLDE